MRKLLMTKKLHISILHLCKLLLYRDLWPGALIINDLCTIEIESHRIRVLGVVAGARVCSSTKKARSWWATGLEREN